MIKDSHVYELNENLLSLKNLIYQKILKFQINIILMKMKKPMLTSLNLFYQMVLKI
jgi:hypothetical protein